VAPPAAKVEQALAAIVATCARCETGVEVRRKGKPYWEPVVVGGLFRDGDWIRTGTKAAARIRFVSGGHLDLDEKTTLLVEASAIKQTGGAEGVRVAVQSGGARGVLDGTSDAPLVIRTKEGEVRIAAARGKPSAEFRLKPGTNGSVEVAVSKGELLVRSESAAGDVERTIEADPVTEPRPKPRPKPRKPAPPIGFPQSQAPRIDARFSCTPGLRIELSWSPLTGASGYRLIVARDMSFRSIVSSTDLEQTRFTLTPPTAGTYVWRVAARDARGRYGEFGFARRIFCDPS